MRRKDAAISCAWQKSAFKAYLVLLTTERNPKNVKIGQNKLFFGDFWLKTINLLG